MNAIEKATLNLEEKGFLDIDTPDIDYVKEIQKLKEEKNAILLAHYYQIDEIQEIADFVGDSLALAQQAAKTDADMIVFAGVHFMAETAKILNPTKKVVLPDLLAGCSLADSCPPKQFSEFKKQHPDHLVVTYINCSAEIKALSDYVCTSSNARKIIDSIPKDQPIIFAPESIAYSISSMSCISTMHSRPSECAFSTNAFVFSFFMVEFSVIIQFVRFFRIDNFNI